MKRFGSIRCHLALLLLFSTTDLLAAPPVYRAPPYIPPSDPRFFGTYYLSSWSTEVCVKYKVKDTIFGITWKEGKECDTVTIKSLHLHLKYYETPTGGFIIGTGEGTYGVRPIPVLVGARIVRKGVAWGMLNVALENKLRRIKGYAYLSNDGLALTVSAMGKQLTMRKDAGDNTPPQVQITYPDNDQVLEYGRSYPFSATVQDDEQAAFPDERLVWGSDLDGVLADRGSPIFWNSLSPGKHVISFEATDNGGLAGKDAVTVVVVNQPPDAPVITQPQDRAQLFTVSPTLFEGKAFDPEDGALKGDALRWVSDKDGILGKGGTVSATLKTPGQHQIQLIATDQSGLDSTTQIMVNAAPYGDNSPPQVKITSPKHLAYAGIAMQSGEEVTFQGWAKDLEDPFDKLELEWRIAGVTASGGQVPEKTFGTGEKVTHKLQHVGGATTYTITLVARDSGGLEGRASMTIVVIPWTIE